MRRTTGLLATLLLCLGLPGSASASQTALLQATFTPERLGHRTTVDFAFQINTPTGEVPSPLTGIEVAYPANLEFALSELGLATCSTETLKNLGPPGCPTNSLMGYGTALAEIPLGPLIYHETAQVAIFHTTNHGGHLALLIYADGITPVNTQIIFPGTILAAPAPFGGRLTIAIPLVPSLPEAPDVAVTQFNATLGPRHIRYHEHTHGRTITYQPRGIPLPRRCPRGGFPFAATFNFLDGSNTTARAAVPCPS